MIENVSNIGGPAPAHGPGRRPTTLIVGAGYIGSALADALRNDGRVVTLRRSPPAAPGTGLAVQADVSRPFDLPALPPLDAVVYLVGADARTPQAYHDAYEAGPAQLLSALARAGQQPRRLIYASSISVHGQADGETLDESSPTEPRLFSGRAVLAGERLLAAGPWPVTRVRFAGIYGPLRDSFVRGVLAGTIGPTEANPYTNRIHRDDCVGVLRRLLEIDAPPPIVLASDPTPTRRNEVIRWLARRAGVEPASQGTHAAERRSAGDRRCHPAWLLADGYRWRHRDFRSGYAELVDAARNRSRPIDAGPTHRSEGT